MANTQAQFGFKQVGYLGGGSPDFQYSTYSISSTNATAIGQGDPVTYVSGSSPFITQATNTTTPVTPIVGIFYGCQYTPTGGGPPTWSPYWPGAQASNGVAYVIDAPNAKFLVAALQTAITSANIGNAINFTTGVPATTGGAFSIATVDQSTATSTGTTNSLLPFRVVGLYPGVGNGSDPTTNYNWVEVAFNNQLNRGFTGA